MERKTVESLKDKSKGDFLYADEIRAIYRTLTAAFNTPDGFRDLETVLQGSKEPSKARYVQVFNDSNSIIPAYAIFSIVGDPLQGTDDPPKITAKKIGRKSDAGGNITLLMTNEDVAIPKNSWGLARIVNDFEPFRANVLGSGSVYIGATCGIEPETYGVSGDRYGLVCIGEDEVGRKWVVRTPEPANVVGVLTSKLTAYNPNQDKLGEGTLKVQLRDVISGVVSDLHDCLDPVTLASDWILPVYNIVEEEYEAGAKIKAANCVGVGLVADAVYYSPSISSEPPPSEPPSSSSFFSSNEPPFSSSYTPPIPSSSSLSSESQQSSKSSQPSESESQSSQGSESEPPIIPPSSESSQPPISVSQPSQGSEPPISGSEPPISGSEPSQGSVSEPSQGSVSEPSQGSVSEPSQGSVSEPPISVSQPSQGSVSQPSQGSVSQPPISGSEPPISEPPISGSEPPISGSEPPISGSEPPISGSQPPISGSQPPISGSESLSSVSAKSESEIGSDKSNAIVPCDFTEDGFTALYVHEMPDVRFDDVVSKRIPQLNTIIDVDPKYIAVCEENTIEVCGVNVSQPVLIGTEYKGGKILVKFAEQDENTFMKLTIRLTALRKGFIGEHGKRFPNKTREQFLRNEEFINSAH